MSIHIGHDLLQGCMRKHRAGERGDTRSIQFVLAWQVVYFFIHEPFPPWIVLPGEKVNARNVGVHDLCIIVVKVDVAQAIILGHQISAGVKSSVHKPTI